MLLLAALQRQAALPWFNAWYRGSVRIHSRQTFAACRAGPSPKAGGL